jgi:hypothetical protein
MGLTLRLVRGGRRDELDSADDRGIQSEGAMGCALPVSFAGIAAAICSPSLCAITAMHSYV